MRFLTLVAVFCGLVGPLSAEPGAGAGKAPVVIELFTSQGCSSCPPADALLKRLAKRPDVLPLALHVDYWDYIGWKDSFAHPSHTRRQKGYARLQGRKMVYTPQMVVMGQLDVLGSDAMAVAEAIRSYQTEPRPVALSFAPGNAGGILHLEAQADLPQDLPILIRLVRFSTLETVRITRGELAGREMNYANVVRQIEELGRWDGSQPMQLDLALRGDLSAAVLLQQGSYGPILAAARLK